MSKKLEDYLHLYIGQQVINKDESEPVKLVGVTPSEYGKNELLAICRPKGSGIYIEFYAADVKPVLRPLLDMTEDEQNELVWAIDKEYLSHSIKRDGSSMKFMNESGTVCTLMFTELHPNHFLYLLKKGFDLFGLIEAGLAIDKTKT